MEKRPQVKRKRSKLNNPDKKIPKRKDTTEKYNYYKMKVKKGYGDTY